MTYYEHLHTVIIISSFLEQLKKKMRNFFKNKVLINKKIFFLRPSDHMISELFKGKKAGKFIFQLFLRSSFEIGLSR